MFLQSMGLDRTGPDTMALAVELINFTAGLITMLVVGILISRLPLKNETLKVLSFGLVALNPKLIGINSHATNDTFVILFCTLALFCTVFFLQKQKPGTFLLILFFTLLSISSKTNGWIIAFVITLALFTKAWVQEKHRLGLVLTGFLFMAATVTISILNPLNQYIPNY
jgi:4-amino-4-deoxy-L-arabinose transferase-like glycosyltransferase